MSKTKKLVMVALMAALMCILSPITIPVAGGVGASLGVFMVVLIAYLLEFPMGLMCCNIYLLLGLVGIPVFSGFQGGLGVFMGPTGGFLIGYLALGAMSGIFLKIGKGNRWIFAGGAALGLLICYIMGALWYMVVTKVNLMGAIVTCVAPYIVFDIIKIAVVCIIGPVFKKNMQ